MKWNLQHTQESDLDEFLDRILKMEPEEFLGVVKLMGISMRDSNELPRDAEDMIVELCSNFVNRNRGQRRQILKLVKTATKFRSLPTYDDLNDEKRKEYDKWKEEMMEKKSEESATASEEVVDGTTTEDQTEG